MTAPLGGAGAAPPQFAVPRRRFSHLSGWAGALIGDRGAARSAGPGQAGAFAGMLASAQAGTASRARPAAAPAEIDSLIQFTAAKYGMNPDLIRSVVRHESNFDPHAVSRVGAQGLMQLMPDTARGLGVTDPFDPAQNLDGGVRFLKAMLKQFGSVPLALAAYNAGPGNVQRYGGIPPFAETQGYVRKIMADLG